MKLLFELCFSINSAVINPQNSNYLLLLKKHCAIHPISQQQCNYLCTLYCSTSIVQTIINSFRVSIKMNRCFVDKRHVCTSLWQIAQPLNTCYDLMCIDFIKFLCTLRLNLVLPYFVLRHLYCKLIYVELSRETFK